MSWNGKEWQLSGIIRETVNIPDLIDCVNNFACQAVIKQANSIAEYRVDANDRWCEVVIKVGLGESKLDVATLIERYYGSWDYGIRLSIRFREVDSFIVTQTPGIERCIEREDTINGKTTLFLQTQGINLEVGIPLYRTPSINTVQALYRHADVLDVNKLYTNDLDLILRTYGAEACSRAIVNVSFLIFSQSSDCIILEALISSHCITSKKKTNVGKIARFI